MNLPGPLAKLMPRLDLDGDRNLVRDAWNLLAGVAIALGENIGSEAPKAQAVYDRFFESASEWSADEVGVLRKVLSSGLEVFRAAGVLDLREAVSQL